MDPYGPKVYLEKGLPSSFNCLRNNMTETKHIEVLLVEDRAEDAELAIDSLRQGGLINEIKLLKDGQEALDYLFGEGAYQGLQQELPKLILLDLKLPKVNGLEVLEKIKNSTKHQHIPIVILTSSKEDIDIEKAYALGANSYIVKPVDFNNFSDAVRQVGLYWCVLNTAKT